MKKTFLLLTLMGFQMAFSQIQEGVKQPYGFTKEQLGPYDKPAEFPGGKEEFINMVIEKVNRERLKEFKGTLQAIAKLSINTKGKIEFISVSGNNETLNKEVERAIKLIKTEWKPAVYNEKPVLYWCQAAFNLN